MILRGAERFPCTPALGAPCSMAGVGSVLGIGLWGGCFPRAGQDGAVPWNPEPLDSDEMRHPDVFQFSPRLPAQRPCQTHLTSGPQPLTKGWEHPVPSGHAARPRLCHPTRTSLTTGGGEGGLMPRRRETPRQVLVMPAAPARCRCFIPRLPGSHPEHLRVIVEQSTKREVPGSGSPRHLGRGRGRGRQRWLCSSIRAAAVSLAAPQDSHGLPHSGEDDAVQLQGWKEWGVSTVHPQTGTPSTAPRSPPTHLGTKLGRSGAVVPEVGGILRRKEPLLHADGSGEGLHLPRGTAASGAGAQPCLSFPRGLWHSCTPKRWGGWGVAELPTWWGAPAGTSTASPRNWRRVQQFTPHSSRSRLRSERSR